MNIKNLIETYVNASAEELDLPKAMETFDIFKKALNEGKVRAAEPKGNTWIVNKWVKQGILLGFRLGILTDISINKMFIYYDKHTFPLKYLSIRDKVRIVPGGS